MGSSLQTAATTFMLCLALAAAAAGQSPPTVRITAWEQSANGTGVTFKASAPTVVSEQSSAFSDETAQGHFEFALDTSDVKWGDDCRCFRYYVLIVRSRRGAMVSRHKIKAVPSGSFEDQRAGVRLTISDATVTDSEDISLPVASAPGLEPAPLVVVAPRESMGSVSLAGLSEIQVEMRNPSKHTTVVVPSDVSIDADHNGLWETPVQVEGRRAPFTLAPGRSEIIRLQFQPKTWEAIQKSFIPSASDKPHTAVRLHVPYANPLFHQREGSAVTNIPIRFRPSIVSLILALASGVALGSLVPLFSRHSASIGRWSRATVTALVAAIVLEAVGMFLVAHDSQLKLFSFDLDPWQTLPVLLLGIGNGLLGFEAARRLKFIQAEVKS